MFYSLLAPDAAQNVNVNMENITASQQKQKKSQKAHRCLKSYRKLFDQTEIRVFYSSTWLHYSLYHTYKPDT